jgi:IS5 family transposase
MDQVVPWKSLLGFIQPFYPLAGRSRQPYPLETMLRVHLMQNRFGLSDPGVVTTPDNESDVAQVDQLLHGKEEDAKGTRTGQKRNEAGVKVGFSAAHRSNQLA